jgi:two-component system chemotaxis response regulator CheB
MNMRKVRVLLVEDSAVVRELLAHIITSDPRLEVAAAVESAEEALRILPRLRPDGAAHAHRGDCRQCSLG